MKEQQMIVHLRMLRASTKTMLTNFQLMEEPNQDEIDALLDTVFKLTKEIERLENMINQRNK